MDGPKAGKLVDALGDSEQMLVADRKLPVRSPIPRPRPSWPGVAATAAAAGRIPSRARPVVTPAARVAHPNPRTGLGGRACAATASADVLTTANTVTLTGIGPSVAVLRATKQSKGYRAASVSPGARPKAGRATVVAGLTASHDRHALNLPQLPHLAIAFVRSESPLLPQHLNPHNPHAPAVPLRVA
jgi:hypothetical protein